MNEEDLDALRESEDAIKASVKMMKNHMTKFALTMSTCEPDPDKLLAMRHQFEGMDMLVKSYELEAKKIRKK